MTSENVKELQRQIDALNKVIDDLYEDRDRWRDWAVDYAYDDETCECDRCTEVRAAWEVVAKARQWVQHQIERGKIRYEAP